MSNAGQVSDSSAAMSGVWSAARGALIAIGGALVTGGVVTSASPLYFWIMFASGAVLVIGPAGYNLYMAINRVWVAAEVRKQTVNATLNLVASGDMEAQNGRKVLLPEGVVLKPATVASAAEIVKNYAPTKAV
jgi:hypothetical protein